MFLRKWLIRGLVLMIAFGGAASYFVVQYYTDPKAVRRAVLDELRRRFPGAEVHLGSARLRLLGGIELKDLRLAGKDDPMQGPLAYLPEVLLIHDKQQLAEGRLAIRKIELRRPQLVLARRADGSWNLAGLAAAGDGPSVPLEVREGELVFIDRVQELGPLEIRHLSLNMTPAENGMLRLEGNGQCQLLGDVRFQGIADSKNGSLSLSWSLPAVHLRPELAAMLAKVIPDHALEHCVWSGQAALSGTLVHHPQEERPWCISARAAIKNGSFKHPAFPGLLDGISAAVQIDGSNITLESFQARALGGRVAATGMACGWGKEAIQELRLRADGMQLDESMYAQLPPAVARLCADFQPRGTLSLGMAWDRKEGVPDLRYTVELQGVDTRFVDFPYPVEDVRGTLAYREENGVPEMRVLVNGRASGQPVRLAGRAYGPGLRWDNDLKPGIEMDLTCPNVPIDQKFLTALETYPESLRTARLFRPQGLLDITARFRRPPQRLEDLTPPPADHYFAGKLHDGRLCFQDFPYPVEQVEGTLEFWLQDQTWRFSGFRASHRSGEFRGDGRSQATALGRRLELTLQGTNVLLDAEMEGALPPRMREAWDLFRPRGRMDFRANLVCDGAGAPALDLLLTARGCEMKPPCFPYAMTNVSGTFRYERDRVLLREFQARHGDCVISLGNDHDQIQSEIRLLPGGGYQAELRRLRAEGLLVDPELLAALPPLVRGVFQTLRPDRPVRILTDLSIAGAAGNAPMTYRWDGHVALVGSRVDCGIELSDVTGVISLRGRFDGSQVQADGNLWLSHAMIGRQPFLDVQARLDIGDRHIAFDEFRARVHGGEVRGPIRVRFAPDLAYGLELTARDVDLEQFARQTLGRQGQVRGKADAGIRLSGSGNDLASLRGEGWVDVPNGAHLYDLPLIFNLLNTLSGHLPRGSFFQEAHVRFTIGGERIQFPQFDLIGNAFTLRGQGWMRSDLSDIHLEMYGLLFGRTLPLLPPLIDKIPPEVSKRLMRIRIQGSLDDARPVLEPVPILVEPVKGLLQGLTGNRGGGEPW